MWRAVIGIALVAPAGNIDQAAAQAQEPPRTVPIPHVPLDPSLQRQFFVTTGKLVRMGAG